MANRRARPCRRLRSATDPGRGLSARRWLVWAVWLRSAWDSHVRAAPVRATDPGRTAITSLAVLPLDNLSGDPAHEYLADGMTEALITDLGKIGSVRVIARASVMKYKGTQASPIRSPRVGSAGGGDRLSAAVGRSRTDYVALIYLDSDRQPWTTAMSATCTTCSPFSAK